MEWLERIKGLLPGQVLGEPAPLVTVLRLEGVIGHARGMRPGLDIATQATAIEQAFKPRKLAAVALSINSPGGSPVQSALIAKRIRDLAKEKEVPVYAFAEDVAASGGYWLALAADEIYAVETSIIGSIGVISAGFGFTELIKKIGIERRVHTAGDKKGMLDPFGPEKPAEVKYLKSIQRDMHDSFIETVHDRRAEKLTGADKEMFSGAFWTGRKALEMGLIDGLGDLRSTLRDRFGENVRLRPVSLSKPFWQGRIGLSAARTGEMNLNLAGNLTADALAAIEERLIWNRFGL